MKTPEGLSGVAFVDLRLVDKASDSERRDSTREDRDGWRGGK